MSIEVKQEVYVTNSLVTVPAGYGDTTVVINFPFELDLNLGYSFILSIRPVGGDWKTNITKKVADFTISKAASTIAETVCHFNVFPNPFKDRFSFTNVGAVASVLVYDARGCSVFLK